LTLQPPAPADGFDAAPPQLKVPFIGPAKYQLIDPLPGVVPSLIES
jgi:hypothetical protein